MSGWGGGTPVIYSFEQLKLIFHIQFSYAFVCCTPAHLTLLQLLIFTVPVMTGYGLDGPGIESRWGGEIFRTCPDRPWGPPSLLYNGY
jgi:hypothetical protein